MATYITGLCIKMKVPVAIRKFHRNACCVYEILMSSNNTILLDY